MKSFKDPAWSCKQVSGPPQLQLQGLREGLGVTLGGIRGSGAVTGMPGPVKQEESSPPPSGMSRVALWMCSVLKALGLRAGVVCTQSAYMRGLQPDPDMLCSRL